MFLYLLSISSFCVCVNYIRLALALMFSMNFMTPGDLFGSKPSSAITILCANYFTEVYFECTEIIVIVFHFLFSSVVCCPLVGIVCLGIAAEAWRIVRSIDCLPCKPKDLSSIPKTQVTELVFEHGRHCFLLVLVLDYWNSLVIWSWLTWNSLYRSSGSWICDNPPER